MIDKIKAIIQLKDELETLKAKFDEHKVLFEDLNGKLVRMVEFSNASLENQRNQSEFAVKTISEMLETLSDQVKDLNSDISDLKLIKAQMQKKIIEELVSDFKDKIMKKANEMQVVIDEFKTLKDEVNELKDMFLQLKADINILSEVATSIKKEDFELTKYTKEIFKADQEKLELMKRIDTLERLIAKQRRGGGPK